ncbi:hypothetical protein CSAL01_11288 [Colletotrichum salicis]|uniref:Uncharacterized protein n=1 Tax=Colletotrichum salicis TaxID=1209931 RepID=A0A135UVV6_9PEZI|nr:hypothetical protein CSAL01_11288 [Colletotrichum salicis]
MLVLVPSGFVHPKSWTSHARPHAVRFCPQAEFIDVPGVSLMLSELVFRPSEPVHHCPRAESHRDQVVSGISISYCTLVSTVLASFGLSIGKRGSAARERVRLFELESTVRALIPKKEWREGLRVYSSRSRQRREGSGQARDVLAGFRELRVQDTIAPSSGRSNPPFEKLPPISERLAQQSAAFSTYFRQVFGRWRRSPMHSETAMHYRLLVFRNAKKLVLGKNPEIAPPASSGICSTACRKSACRFSRGQSGTNLRWSTVFFAHSA